jgi:hypothetical protein
VPPLTRGHAAAGDEPGDALDGVALRVAVAVGVVAGVADADRAGERVALTLGRAVVGSRDAVASGDVHALTTTMPRAMAMAA